MGLVQTLQNRLPRGGRAREWNRCHATTVLPIPEQRTHLPIVLSFSLKKVLMHSFSRIPHYKICSYRIPESTAAVLFGDEVIITSP